MTEDWHCRIGRVRPKLKVVSWHPEATRNEVLVSKFMNVLHDAETGNAIGGFYMMLNRDGSTTNGGDISRGGRFEFGGGLLHAAIRILREE